jgi:hypothetical protein
MTWCYNNIGARTIRRARIACHIYIYLKEADFNSSIIVTLSSRSMKASCWIIIILQNTTSCKRCLRTPLSALFGQSMNLIISQDTWVRSHEMTIRVLTMIICSISCADSKKRAIHRPY